MVVFSRASIVPFVALPVIVGLCRSDTGFFHDPRGVSKAPVFGDGRRRGNPFLVGHSVASIDPVKSLSTWARTAAILALGVMLTAFLSQSKRRVDLALQSLTISSFGLLLFTRYFHSIFTLRLSNSSVSSRVERHRIADSQIYFSVSACILPIIVWAVASARSTNGSRSSAYR